MGLRRYLFHWGSLHISAGSKDKRLSLSFAGGVRVWKETFPSHPSSARIFSIPRVRSPSIWTSFSLYPFGFNLLTCKTSLSPLFSGVSAPASATFPPRLALRPLLPLYLRSLRLLGYSSLITLSPFLAPLLPSPRSTLSLPPYPSCPLAQHIYVSAFLPIVLPRFP